MTGKQLLLLVRLTARVLTNPELSVKKKDGSMQCLLNEYTAMIGSCPPYGDGRIQTDIFYNELAPQ